MRTTSTVRRFVLSTIALLYIPRYGKGDEKALRRKGFWFAKRVVRKARGIISRMSLLPGRLREQFALGLIELGNLMVRMGLRMIPEAPIEDTLTEAEINEWLAWEAENGQVGGIPSTAARLDRLVAQPDFDASWDDAEKSLTPQEAREMAEWDAALTAPQAKPLMVCSVEEGLAAMGGEKNLEDVAFQPLADFVKDQGKKPRARKPKAKAVVAAHAVSPSKSAVPPSKKKLAAMTPEELVALGRAMGIKGLSTRMKQETLIGRITS